MTKLESRTTGLRAGICASALAFSIALGTGSAHAEEALFTGCPSGPIIQRFIEFGKTGKMPPDLGKWLSNPEAQKIEPWQPFDNVTYVGVCWVSAWLIETEDGSVLIDTLYGPYTRQLIANLEATGVDFADIKYVLMTHGHFDHAGGAAALKPRLPNAKFVMTEAGWDEATASAAESQGTPRAWEMIEPEIVAKDSDTIELGGNTFQVIETPGHTWGTASYLYDVTDGNRTHRAITIGGLGLNAIEGPPQVEAYIASVDRVRTLVEGDSGKVEVHLTTHGFSAGLNEKRQRHLARAAGAPNVFVDAQALLKQVAGLRARAVDRLEQERAKAKQ